MANWKAINNFSIIAIFVLSILAEGLLVLAFENENSNIITSDE